LRFLHATMPRLLFAGLTIVAAFLAGTPVSAEDVPLTPQMIELADRLYVDPLQAPTRFLPEIVRLLYGIETPKAAPLVPPRSAVHLTEPIVTVPVPLTVQTWSREVFHRSLSAEQLVPWILSDPRAALLARGLAGLDDETLAYFADRPALVGWLYERAASVFGAFAHNLRIRGGRIVVRHGEEAAPLWEAVVRQPLSNPDRFIRGLFVEDGRLAYLFDVVDGATVGASRFVIGSWIADPQARIVHFKSLAAALANSYREWRPADHPFLRPLGDLAVLLLRLNLDPSGAPLAPASRTFWASVFDVGGLRAPAGSRADENADGDRIDAAFLVNAFGTVNAYQRVDLADTFGFGQRLLAGTSTEPGPDVVEVVKAFRERRMVLLMLEAIGIRSPVTYRAVLQRVDALDAAVENRRFWTLAQFQGAFALVARMEIAGVIDSAAAERLVLSLSAVPTVDSDYRGAVAAWARREWAPRLLPGASWEARVIASISGPAATAAAPRVLFEGQPYRLDLAYAERQRIETVRRKQAGQTLDVAFAIDAVAATLKTETGSADRIREAATQAHTILGESAERLKPPSVAVTPPGVGAIRDAFDWLTGEADELDRAARTNDWRRAVRAGASLQQLADIALGHALLSLTYAAAIGDPDGPALLAGNVALRHDFGFSRHIASDAHPRAPWAMPRQEFQPGIPWHVTGSLLGLDVALAPLSLHRLAVDRFGVAPSLSSIEREAFPAGVTLLDPRRMKDSDAAAIAAAIDRGRARVDQLSSSSGTLERIADDLVLDGYRRRALAWTVANERSAVRHQFSLSELLYLGGGARDVDLDAWGPPAIHGTGCACTWFPPPNAWRVLAGRFQLPMMAATMGDLTLAVALKLHARSLPVALVRPVLAMVMQDFFDDQSAAYGGDWHTLSQQAQDAGGQNIEDYVSAAAAVNGPLVPVTPASSQH
jgi:hypothetical protein